MYHIKFVINNGIMDTLKSVIKYINTIDYLCYDESVTGLFAYGQFAHEKKII